MTRNRPVVGLPTLDLAARFRSRRPNLELQRGRGRAAADLGGHQLSNPGARGASGFRAFRAPAARRASSRPWASPICRPCARPSSSSRTRPWDCSADPSGARSPFTHRCRWRRSGSRRSCRRSSARIPSIDVRLSSVIWDNPGPDESTDLEIRYGNGHWHGYRAERLMNQRIVAVCSPAMLERARSRGDAAGVAAATSDPHHGTREPLAAGAPVPAARRRSAGEVGPDRGHDHRRARSSRPTARAARSRIGSSSAPTSPPAGWSGCWRHDFEDESSYFVVTPERPQRLRREVAAIS